MPRSRPEDAAIPVRLAEQRRRDVEDSLKQAKADRCWTSVSQLTLQLRKSDEVVVIARRAAAAAKADTTATLTPAEAANQLSEAIRAAPVAVQYRIFQEILGAHPNWSDDE